MKPFIVSEDLWFCENAVYLPKVETLVISDLQLGYEQQLREAGANVIYEQALQMMGLLGSLIDQTKAKRLVIDGDLKHEFGRITFQERRDILKILTKFNSEIEIIVVRGNHDKMTKPLTDELGIKLLDAWESGGFYAVHGHELPDESDPKYKASHTIIIGHMHPAIRINDGVRNERFKCFLIDTYKKKRVVVLPSFSTIVEGSDVLQVASNSPFVKGHSGKVFVIADEIRAFGKVADLQRLLG